MFGLDQTSALVPNKQFSPPFSPGEKISISQSSASPLCPQPIEKRNCTISKRQGQKRRKSTHHITAARGSLLFQRQ